MAIINKVEPDKLVIDLDGPEGNAFVILGLAVKLGKQMGMSVDKVAEIQKEMKSSDYENLIQTFDKYFGEHVDLMRS